MRAKETLSPGQGQGPGPQNRRFDFSRLLPERNRKAAEGSMIKLIAP